MNSDSHMLVTCFNVSPFLDCRNPPQMNSSPLLRPWLCALRPATCSLAYRDGERFLHSEVFQQRMKTHLPTLQVLRSAMPCVNNIDLHSVLYIIHDVII